MTTVAQLHSTTDGTRVRRSAALPRAGRAIQDLAADWKRWSVAERAAAVAALVVMSAALLISIA